MTDFRTLCTELVDELESWIAFGDEADGADAHALVDRARTALAKPEPQGPTDEELLAAQDQAVASFPPIHPDAEALSAVEYAQELEIRKGRAVLARWGRLAIEPVPVSERLPRLKDWNAEWRCWGLTSTPYHDGCCYKTWKLVPCSWIGPGNTFTHWLPHWALPVLKSEVSNG